MNNDLISVVIPVYNVEKYLDRCIESIVNQTYKKLEILLIDDGSPDNCPKMCDEWAEKDARIKVIHKQNAGLGMARNTGIENATGNYICFVDSDDYVDFTTIEVAYNRIKADNSQIATYGYNAISKNLETLSVNAPKTSKFTYSDKEIFEYFIPNVIAPNVDTGEKTYLWMSACASLFDKSLIDQLNWRFVSEREIISEDVYSLLLLYKNLTKVSVINKAFYNYCENETSLTHSYRADRFNKIKEFYHLCCKEVNDLNSSIEIVKRFQFTYLSYLIACMKHIVLSDLSNNSKSNEIKRIINDDTTQSILKVFNLNNQPITWRILYGLAKHKLYLPVILLIKIKSSN